MAFDPYQAPREHRDARPAVIVWFRVYSAVMMLLSLGMVGLAVLMGYEATRPEVALSANGAGAPLVAIVLTLLATAMVVLYAVATFVPFKPWGWSVGLVAIGLGLAGGTAIFAIPLLVFWLKPEAKAAFARF